MSFGPSSNGRNVNNQYSTLWLTGGYDCTCNFDNLHVDLRVAGGAYIAKNLCVQGNMHGDLVTSKIYEQYPGSGIDIVGNVYIDPDYSLFAKKACINTLLVDTIEEKNLGEGINIVSNVHMSLGTVLDADTIIANSIIVINEIADTILSNLVIANTVCIFDDLLVDIIKAKTGNLVTLEGDLFVTGNINIVGNVHNLTLLTDAGTLPQNVSLVSNGIGPHLSVRGLVAGNGITLTQTGITDITISSTGGGGGGNSWVGLATSNLNMDCYLISNVHSISVSTITPDVKCGNSTISMNGNVQVNGCFGAMITDYNFIEINSAYTVKQTDNVVAANTIAGPILITLPKISTLSLCMKKMQFSIVDIGGVAERHNITIKTTPGDTIVGGTGIILSGNYNAIHICSNMVNKWVVF